MEKEGYVRALRGVPPQDAKFKRLMSDVCLRKAGLLFRFGSLVVDDEDDVNNEDDDLDGHESDTSMDGDSVASLSEGGEEGEGDDDHDPSPCRRVSSGGR